MNLRINWLLSKVTLSDPSTQMTYWSNCLTSMTLPVLCHFFGYGPVKFCNRTKSPTFSGGKCLVCLLSRSDTFMCLTRRASFRDCRVSIQVGCGSYFPRWIGMKSRIDLPKRHWAGDSLVLLSGVLRYCNIALRKQFVLRQPLAPVFLKSSLLMVFTPTSALQLLCSMINFQLGIPKQNTRQ